MRIFAAIDISDSARCVVSSYIERLRYEFPQARVGWTRAEKLHLTLKFFGETNEAQLSKLAEAVEAVAKDFSPFDLQIVGAGVFPSPRKARVLWLGARAENDNLRKLSERLEDECARRGFPKDNRIFKAHLTIARLKQNADAALIEKHLDTNLAPSEPFQVSEITIYQSELLPRGSRYKIISKTPFYN